MPVRLSRLRCHHNSQLVHGYSLESALHRIPDYEKCHLKTSEEFLTSLTVQTGSQMLFTRVPSHLQTLIFGSIFVVTNHLGVTLWLRLSSKCLGDILLTFSNCIFNVHGYSKPRNLIHRLYRTNPMGSMCDFPSTNTKLYQHSLNFPISEQDLKEEFVVVSSNLRRCIFPQSSRRSQLFACEMNLTFLLQCAISTGALLTANQARGKRPKRPDQRDQIVPQYYWNTRQKESADGKTGPAMQPPCI